MTNLHVLQHIACEGPGAIAAWAGNRGYSVSTTHLYRGESLPDPTAVDLLVVMGGPMNIYQDRDHPWLRAERAFIQAHIASGKPAIGICLGAQFLADALGGRVLQNPQVEIGWHPVEFTAEARDRFAFLPPSLEIMHWHGETFEHPAGALHLARSADCANQGFLYDGRILALQFHPEVAREDLAAWIREFPGELKPSAYVQDGSEILAKPEEAFATGQAFLHELLDAIFPIR